MADRKSQQQDGGALRLSGQPVIKLTSLISFHTTTLRKTQILNNVK